MLDQRAQDGGRRGAAERADEGPVVRAGPPLPAAVARGHAGGVVEKMRGFCQHEIFSVLENATFRTLSVIASHRVGAKRRPMTGSAKQSRSDRRKSGLLRFARNDAVGRNAQYRGDFADFNNV